MKLEGIYESIRDQLQLVDDELRNRLLSENELRQLNEYILNSPGKRLRPALVLLSARVGNHQQDLPAHLLSPLVGEPKRGKIIHVAVAIEIIHTATLIHDDVVDKSELRRGQPTINSKWGDGISIILGDYWHSKAFSILYHLEVPEVLETLLKVVNTMCMGELEQLKKCYELSLTEGEYLEIVEKKTAFLMSSCCKLGALVGEVSQREIQSLSNYGLNLGIAFQITDDCLDLVGSEEKMRKSLGSDLFEGKLTLPLIYTISVADKKDREWVKSTFESRQINSSTLNQMRDIVRRYRGIEYALRKADEYRKACREELKSLKESESRNALSLIADYVVKRGYERKRKKSINSRF